MVANRTGDFAVRKIFRSIEGRLPMSARNRLLRLLPSADATDEHARQQYEKVYSFVLKKNEQCFPDYGNAEKLRLAHS